MGAEIEIGDVEHYTYTNHMDWIDANNLGVLQVGIHPESLPLANIIFDKFSMKCLITRQLMTLLCAFILNKYSSSITQFMVLLTKFWNNFLPPFAQSNKHFTSFNGMN